MMLRGTTCCPCCFVLRGDVLRPILFRSRSATSFESDILPDLQEQSSEVAREVWVRVVGFRVQASEEQTEPSGESGRNIAFKDRSSTLAPPESLESGEEPPAGEEAHG